MAQEMLTAEERKKRYEEFRRRREGTGAEPVNTDEAEREERQKEIRRRKEEIRKRRLEEEKVKKRRRTVLIVMTEMVIFLLLSITCYGFSILNSYEYVELDPTVYKESRATAEQTVSVATETSYVDVTNESGEVIERSVINVTVPEETRATGYRTILVLGLDKGEQGNRYGYEDEGRNSDVIIIVSINNDTGEIRMASVMRDMIVRMEDGSYYPYGKANDQFAQSGLSETVSMINRNFGLDIDEYVTINWYSVANVINQMGGVELTIPNEQILWYFNGYLTEVNESTGLWAPQLEKPGTYLMTGTQAVSFCRIRYGGYNDDGRTEHQREVITKLFEKAKSMGKNGEIGLLLNIAKEALGTVQTNLKLPDIFRMVSELDTYTMNGSIKVPSSYETAAYVGSYYAKYRINDPVVATDFEQEVINLHKFLYNEDYEPNDFIKGISAQMYKDRKAID